MKRRALATFLAVVLTCSVVLPGNTVRATELPETMTEVSTEASTEVEEQATEELTEGESETAESETPEEDKSPEAEQAGTEEAATEETETEETETEETETEALPEESAEKSAPEKKIGVDELENLEIDEDMKLASGTCGTGVTWSYANGTLTISGNGAMKDYPVYDTPGSPQCMPWYSYKNQITTVNIAEGVTSIGACAFWGCSALQSVTTPSTIQTIGFAAFADCTSLENITIKAGHVGESAFIRCTNLHRVTVGNRVTGFGISAFEGCAGLQRVDISDVAAWCSIDFGGYLANPLQFAKHLYVNGAEVIDLQIPNGVTAIRDYAFEYAQSITSVTIPSSVTTIGDYAFYACNAIQTVNMPSGGVTRIGASAFDSCASMRNITIPDSVSYIGTYAFAWSQITSVNMKQGVIEGHAFEGCGCIADVTLGKDVTYIGDNAFNRCNSIRIIRYGGSRAQWSVLEKGINNEPLTSGNVVYRGNGEATTDGIDRTQLHVGGIVKFGAYEQDNNGGNGKETIEWIVLDIQGDKILVVSKNVLDFQRYAPNIQNAVTWENSSVRSWLNSDFYNAAFTGDQKNNIYSTTVGAENSPVYGVAGGNATNDKIFLLSASEATNYLNTDGKRMSNCTEYALARNNDPALRNQTTQSSYWWVRTPGMFNYDAAYVHYTGSVRYDGMAVANVIGGIRPAMWVNKNAVEVVPGVNPTVEEEPALEGTPIEQFVTRLYIVCLNRRPDDNGKNYWTGLLSSGQTTGTMAAYGFIFSQEFQNCNYCNEDYVKQLYRAFMGREYDDGGLNNWVTALETGTTREEVFNGFAQSVEFAALCSQYGIVLGDGIMIPQYGTVPKGPCLICCETDGVTAFVTRLYNICLDRNPDEAGLSDWTNKLWNHTSSGKDVAFGFIFSPEFMNKGLSDEDYVEYLYRAFFDRPADNGGKSDWLNRMHAQGYSREDVFNGFVGSAEFDNLCKRYGITRE